jgi:LysM repeat protein
MRFHAILTSLCIVFSMHLFAGTLPDSIGVENVNGKKIILHKIEPKDTYYSISRRYHTTPASVIEFNNNKPLHPGDQVKVPTTVEFVQYKTVTVTNSPAQTPKSENIVDYKVGPKETLYSISKRFNTTVDDIKTLNKLSSDGLTVGRVLKVRYGSAPPQAQPQPIVSPPVLTKTPDTTPVDSSGNASDRLKLPAIRYGLREITERGIAVFITDAGLDNTRMLALHRTAPVGTIVKITNPMTNKTTFAKVVGKITDNDSTRDAIIVVNKATADLIGAIDQRFQVTLVYGLSNEPQQ